MEEKKVDIKYEDERLPTKRPPGNPAFGNKKLGITKSGNYNGRPKGTRTIVTMAELKRVCDEVGYDKSEHVIQHYVKRAYESDQVLCHLMNKLFPSRITLETPESQKLYDMIAERFKKIEVEKQNVIDVGGKNDAGTD